LEPVEDSGHRLRDTWRALARELSAFGVVGAVCFVLDVALFQLLYAAVGVGAVPAKVVATVASMTVAFVGHRYWSFAHRSRNAPGRQYVRFAVINGVTLGLGVGIVAFVHHGLGQDGALALQAANVTGIAIGTAIRYLSYRRWVFPAVQPARPAVAPAPAESAGV
jgi:putative flippase GtrA